VNGKMKLNELEVGNYLTRFFERLHADHNQHIFKNINRRMVVFPNAYALFFVDTKDFDCNNPIEAKICSNLINELSAYNALPIVKQAATVNYMPMSIVLPQAHYFGATGYGYISFKEWCFGGAEEVTMDLPRFTFDMDIDIKNLMAWLESCNTMCVLPEIKIPKQFYIS